jgi:hypothetical protein
MAGETEVLGENLPQRPFVHHKSHLTKPGSEPGPPRWEASDLPLFMLTIKLIYNGFITPSSYETFPNKYFVAYISILKMEPEYSVSFYRITCPRRQYLDTNISTDFNMVACV